jgi:hypothetical protein
MNHLYIYYNTLFKKMMWINGRGLSQMQYVVVPNGYHVLLGIDGTDHPFLIRIKLFLIKDTIME